MMNMMEGYKSRFDATQRRHRDWRPHMQFTIHQRRVRHQMSPLTLMEKSDERLLFSGAIGRSFAPLVTNTLTLSWR
jgi:hypothetical protein